LREFYRRCRPPGWWKPVVDEFDADNRLSIRRETMTDVLDCLLGVVFCTASILVIISPLGRHWIIFAGALLVGVLSGGLFIARWARRGVFRSLSTDSAETVVKEEKLTV
jgi:hypothetical protein